MRMTKAEREAANAEARAEFKRQEELRREREHGSEEHVFEFVRKFVPDFDPNKTSVMASEYFDDLPKWLHELVTEAEAVAGDTARAEAKSAARSAAEKAEQETYIATFKRVFDQNVANEIARREGRWVYDASNDFQGRMLADDERIVDGEAVKMSGVTGDQKLAQLFANKRD